MSDEKKVDGQETSPALSIPRTYVNAVQVTHTFYDFQLIFGTAVPDLGKKEVALVVIPAHLIYMSPQHMKNLTTMLIDQVAKYEEQFGARLVPGAPKSKKAQHKS